MRHGAVVSNAEVGGALRSGTVALVAETSKAVTFTSAMPDANYQVALTHDGAISAVGLSAQSKTVDGFTILATLALSGSVGYIAVSNT